MKKLFLFLMSGLLILNLISCNTTMPSSDNAETENTDIPLPEESVSPSVSTVSDKAIEKIHEIYDHASIEKQTVTGVQDLAILTSICASIDGAGPISVTPATYNGEKITLVTLGGTQNVEGQATTVMESALASFGKQNDYLTAVENLIENGTIPENKPMIVAGISLGGMVAQQLTGKTELLAKHGIEIKQVICFGSPFTYPANRNEIPVVRFTDSSDPVPKMGETMILSGLLGKLSPEESAIISKLNTDEKIIETGQYSGIEAHALSYISESCWDSYDFTGSKDKENILILEDKMTFYPAPRLS